MRTSRLCAAAAILALVAAPFAIGQPEKAPAPKPAPAPAKPTLIQPAGQPPADGGPRRPGEGRPGMPPGGPEFRNVEQAMKVMNRSAKALGAALEDTSKKEATLALIGSMQRAAVTAKGMKPEHLKPGFTADDFRKNMITLVGYMLELESAVLDGKTDAAKAAFKKIEDHRDASHEKMVEEEKEEDEKKEDNGKK